MTFDEFLQRGLLNYEKMKEFVLASGYKKVLMIVDESQRYFADLKNSENEKYFFFEYHRHIGLDVLLICQVWSALPKRLVELCEFVISAKPRTIKLVGFQYDFLDAVSKNKLFTKTLKLDKTVFSLYQSYIADEVVKPKSVARNKFIVGLSVASVMLLMATIYANRGFVVAHGENKQKVTATKSVSQVVETSNTVKIDDEKQRQEQIEQLKSMFDDANKELEKENGNDGQDNSGYWEKYKLGQADYNKINVLGRVKGKMKVGDDVYVLYQ